MLPPKELNEAACNQAYKNVTSKGRNVTCFHGGVPAVSAIFIVQTYETAPAIEQNASVSLRQGPMAPVYVSMKSRRYETLWQF